MDTLVVFGLAAAIGVIAGLRSMTAPALICWAARLGWIHLQDSRLAFLGSTVAAAIFTLLAIGELVADKLPATPNRTSAGPLIGRILMGLLCGTAICLSANLSNVAGALLGAVGALVGTFGGYQIRHRLVQGLKVRDVVIAVAEDVVTIGGGLLIVSRF